jgi:hypothetical protein
VDLGRDGLLVASVVLSVSLALGVVVSYALLAAGLLGAQSYLAVVLCFTGAGRDDGRAPPATGEVAPGTAR